MRWAWLVGLTLCACEGVVSGRTGGGAAGGSAGGAPQVERIDGGTLDGGVSTAVVFEALKPTCEGCHVFTSRPFFASLAAFESVIVSDPRWVVPGAPERSALLSLLEGTVNPMPPPPSLPFARLAEAGQTRIDLPQLAAWIRGLAPPGAPRTPPRLVRRKTAEQIARTLMDQLGLVEADFYDGAFNLRASDGYAVRSPDLTPFVDPFEQGGTLFAALGGPHHLEGKWRNDGITPSSLQALTHVSQAWCRAAVEKPGNRRVLRLASLTDRSATPAGAAAIRANIAALWLAMTGEPATAADVDDLFASVFQAYEPRGTATAWTAVCAAIVRDPLWMTW